MKTILCLFFLMGIGVALGVFPTTLFRLVTDHPNAVPVTLWNASASTFAIPGALFLFRFGKNPVVRQFPAIWGMWVLFLSVWLLFTYQAYCPTITFYGIAALAGTLVCSLGLIVFSVIEISEMVPKKKSKNQQLNPTA